MDFKNNDSQVMGNVTELPIEHINYALGRVLSENINNLSNGNCMFKASDRPLTEKDIELIKNAWSKNPSNFPDFITLKSVLTLPKQESLTKNDRNKSVSVLADVKKNFKMQLYKNNIEEELEKITNDATKLICNIKFVGNSGSVSYNYLDYGMAKPFSYERTVNALLFIVSLGKAYNLKATTDKQINLQKLSEVALLSTIGDIYSNSANNNTEQEKIGTKMELSRLYSDMYGNNNFKVRCPNFDLKMLDKYNKEYLSLYSFLMLKGKGNYSPVDIVSLDAILKTMENVDGSGPLGIVLKLDKENAAKPDIMAQIIKIGFLWQDKLIELRENSDKQNITGEISNVADFYQSLRQLAKDKIVDNSLLELMITTNPIYQNGDIVLLSNNKLGSIIKQNNTFPEQPLVGYKDEKGLAAMIDLYKTFNITIKNGFATYELENIVLQNKTKETLSSNLEEDNKKR